MLIVNLVRKRSKCLYISIPICEKPAGKSLAVTALSNRIEELRNGKETHDNATRRSCEVTYDSKFIPVAQRPRKQFDCV